MMKKYIFTEQQLAIIQELANNGSTRRDIGKAMGVDRSVITRLINEGVITLTPSTKNRMGKKFPWNPKRIQKLKEMYLSSNYSLSDICEYFGVSEHTVVTEARRLGINKVHKDFFSEEDINFLKENIGKMSFTDIGKHLNKCDESIASKARELNLMERFHWRRTIMPTDDKFLSDLGNPALSLSAIARKYNFSVSVIQRWRAEKFGTMKQMRDTFLGMSTSEMDFEDILIDLHLAYLYESVIEGWKADFNLGFNFIVEIQGSYWHDKVEKVIEKDKRKFQELKEAGYTVLEIWDYELKDIPLVKTKVLNMLKICIEKYYGSLNLVNS